MLYLVRSRGLCTLQEQCSGQEKSWLSWISVSFITNTLPQASVNYFLTRFDFNLETSSSQVKTKSDSAYLVSTWFSLKYVSTISPDPPFSVHEFFYCCISILTYFGYSFNSILLHLSSSLELLTFFEWEPEWYPYWMAS
jgi:hypothetical protein